MFDTQVGGAVRQIVGPWWAFLVAGVAWFVISFVVLQMSLTSVRAVGVLLGVIFLMSAIEEFLAASVVGSWSWARVLLGVLFFVAAIWSFIDPVGTFVSIADVLGLLQIFKGTFDLISSIMSQPVNPVWWLGLIAGLLEGLPRLLGIAAIFPGSGDAPVALGRPLRPVQRHLLDRVCLSPSFRG